MKLLIIILSLYSLVWSEDENVTEKLIRKQILGSEYDRTIRPSDQVNVSVQISLKQIVNIDEKNQIMTTSSYLFLQWYDPRLTWTKSDFNNLELISIPAKQIWLPDLFVTNTAESNGFINVYDPNLAYVTPKGFVFLTLSLVGLKTRCIIRIKQVFILVLLIYVN